MQPSPIILSLTVGPATWWHGWSQNEFDAIAGAIAAGHLIECGPMACGGNYSGFRELGDVIRLGFPIAEIAADGSTVITKQSGTGGMVTVDTVKSQLLYEVQGTRYLNPDAVLHLDSLNLSQLGKDQVRISAVKGSNPPSTTYSGAVTVTVAVVACLLVVVPGIVYVPGPRIHSTAFDQVTFGCSTLPSLYVTATVLGSTAFAPSITETDGFSTETTARGATAPVRTYEKVLSDSSGLPSQIRSVRNTPSP